MKKKLTGIIFFLFVLSSSAVFGNPQTAVWQRIYQNSVNDEMRYAVLLNIQELHDAGFTDLLTQALSSLLMRGIESGSLKDVDMKVKLATLLVRQLGQLNATTAADEVFQVYENVKEHPFLKAEAAMALGEMHATDDVPYLVRSLNDLNLAPDPRNAEAQEILAFGLVQSLALMHDPRGFEPVFYASIGWYGPERKVKQTAKKLLRTMVPDPTDNLIKIIQSQT
ncbi:MAG: HEAT repeat domain-containing protein, partial [Spirochaetales bacterium]|nr:HEAT repeat domain-containing protein [Spirochaetales bacterium]